MIGDSHQGHEIASLRVVGRKIVAAMTRHRLQLRRTEFLRVHRGIRMKTTVPVPLRLWLGMWLVHVGCRQGLREASFDSLHLKLEIGS